MNRDGRRKANTPRSTIACALGKYGFESPTRTAPLRLLVPIRVRVRAA